MKMHKKSFTFLRIQYIIIVLTETVVRRNETVKDGWYMSRKEKYSERRMLRESLPVLGAIFLAIASVAYILFKNWSNKMYDERWKDYEDCGI